MPRKPLQPCRYPGCAKLSDQPYCFDHRQLFARESATVRGYDIRWQAARRLFLRAHPLCVECLKHGILRPATVVDHIVPHRGDANLFWDEDNWQPLCKRCHDTKTGMSL